MTTRSIVVAVGVFAVNLCRLLRERGHDVQLVTTEESCAMEVERELELAVVVADPTSARTLEDAGMGSADQVVVYGNDEAQTLLICQLAKLRFRVPQLIPVVDDPRFVRVFHRAGLEGAFSSVEILSRLVEERSRYDALKRLQPLADGAVDVAEIRLGPDAPSVGHSLSELGLPRGALIAYVKRRGEVEEAHGDTELFAEDELVLLAPHASFQACLSKLLG